MHNDDAAAFIIDCVRSPRNADGYPTYGYEVYLPNIIAAYLQEVERTTEHHSTLRNGVRARDLSPAFYDAAWEFCRRGILRPGVKTLGGQSDGGTGNGYTVTSLGRSWIAEGASAAMLIDPGRLGELFNKLSKRLGPGFSQRANEAARCHTYGVYLASCAMCGAAAESILLSVAIAKSGDEAAVMAKYRTSGGRQRVVEGVVGQAKHAIASQFRSATGLLSYWRDEAAHGMASNISEIEAHEALARLLHFAQFVYDNWNELARPDV
jgi:hypothetical protein